MIKIGDIYPLPASPEPFVDRCIVIREKDEITDNFDTAYLFPGTERHDHHAQVGEYYANCYKVLRIPEKILKQYKSIGEATPEEIENLQRAVSFVERL